MMTNRNAYISSHNLRVSTAGPDARFWTLKGIQITLETEFSPEKQLRGDKLRKKKIFPVEQTKSVQNVEVLILSTIMTRERPFAEAVVWLFGNKWWTRVQNGEHLLKKKKPPEAV